MKTGILIALLSAALGISTVVSVAQPIAPVDNSGRKLNLDFEEGTLRDWKPEGLAFDKQPVRGDAVAKRNGPGGRSAHQGEFWIGGYEAVGDNETGTLASVPFKVTQSWAAFLVAGGGWPATRVELLETGANKPFFKVVGEESESLRHVVVDLAALKNKEIFIRIVDEQKGHWGHINFDDFKFYATRPKFENEIDPRKQADVPQADSVLFDGLSAEDAVAKMSLPSGFKATLFASEPDVKQPIGFCLDDRGRLWVAEGHTYPLRAKEGEGKDRIVVFEDTNGDGKYDKRTVVREGLNLVSGIEYGFGGVWIGAAPYLMFIPITEGDEPKAAGEPRILLDGWGYQDTHETLNTFTWGPDGWLYGCQGVFTHSNVGRPGAPDDQRVKINAGIWRYHPTKHVFEVFAHGTSNPWGIDFDENGQCIIEACVIPHFFHMIQGGRFHRQAGSHFNPYTYDDIKPCGDHVHWAGNKGPHAGNNRSDSAGGGHAHCGLMIYQGDNWPEQFRGKVFIGNLHGQRINMDILERKGSGVVGSHGDDPINFNDKWSQVLNFIAGPDGAVYFIDWYDRNQCHHNDPNGHDRSNGRIFKIGHGELKKMQVDLRKLSSSELATLLTHKNIWHARHAQRILQERAATTKAGLQDIKEQLVRILENKSESSHQLRALWTLHATRNLDEVLVLSALKSEGEYVRAWTIQFIAEQNQVGPKAKAQLLQMAQTDKSAVVRLYLASAMQRLPVSDRWEIVEALASHGEDASDHNIPLMVWYAAEPLAAQNAQRALQIAENSKLPNLLNFTIRRTAAIGTPEALAEVVKSLDRVDDDARRLQIVNGFSLAFQGQRSAPMPKGWDAVEKKLSNSTHPEIRAQVQSLALTFGSTSALQSLRETVLDTKADANARRMALESLLNAKTQNLSGLLQSVLADAHLRGLAIRGLAAYDDPQTPAKIIQAYNSFDDANRRDALNTLVSRASFAKPLVDAVASNQVPKKDLTADLIRQLRGFKNDELNAQLEKVWGAVRGASADKKPLIEKYKQIYRAGGSQPGDASRGRVVFDRACGQCHTLFDVGGKVGPDLTGSHRGDLDYILENMVDPNAVIPNDYRTSTLDTKDDRVITGIVKAQDDKSVTIVTPTETLVILRDEIASLMLSELSMMPEGLLEPLAEQEIRDLIYYLRQPGQVPLATSGGQ
jgi:putative membrane-bound dehydrogenase-like protein